MNTKIPKLITRARAAAKLAIAAAAISLFAAPAFSPAIAESERNGERYAKYSAMACLNEKTALGYEGVFEEDAGPRFRRIWAGNPSAYSPAVRVSTAGRARAAERFMAENAGIFFNGRPGVLKIESVGTAGAVTMAVMGHYEAGVRVFGSQASVFVNAAGEVIAVNSRLASIEKAPLKTGVGIGDEGAVDAVKRHVKCSATRGKAGISRAVYPGRRGEAVDALVVLLPSKEPLGDFEAVVGSADGRVLECRDLMQHFTGTSGGRNAKTFAGGRHPTLNDGGAAARYGSVFLSNPARCRATREVLPNLVSTYRQLKGKWAVVSNEDAENNKDYIRPDADGNFIFDPKNIHFDEVNAYFHTDRIHDLYAAVGFNGLDRPVLVVVHYDDEFDNAYYSPIFGYIALGDGKRKNDHALEEAVIYHEYSHAVTHAIVKLTGGEAGAMNEAFSDYFPASFTGDPLIGEWIMAKAGQPYLRNLENFFHYPEDIDNEPHHDGRIFSGALWAVRRELGATAADRIIHASRRYLTSVAEPRFADGLAALLAASREIDGGASCGAITAIFARHGVTPAETAPSTPAELESFLKARAVNGDTEARRALENFRDENFRLIKK